MIMDLASWMIMLALAGGGVLAQAAESADVPGQAWLYGHTWLCGPCQHALVAVGVRTFHVVPGGG